MNKLTATNFSQSADKFINDNHKRIHDQAILSAGYLAEAKAVPEDVERHKAEIRVAYEAIFQEIKKRLQGDTHRTHGKFEKQVGDTEIAINKERIDELKQERLNAKMDRDRIHITYNWKNYRLILFVEVLIFIGEFIFNIFPFTVTGGNLFIAAIASFAFSIALGIGAFKIPVVLKKIESVQKRIKVGSLIMSGMLALLFAVSLLRGAMIAGNGTLSTLFAGAVILAAFVFVIITFGMFCMATLFAWFLPSDEEHKEKQKYDKLNAQCEEKTKEIDALEKRNRAIPIETLRTLQDKVNTIKEEEYQQNHIVALAEKTVKAFENEYNLKKRDTPLLLANP